jgi:capsular polysaccharide biosynthesis protein
MIKKKMKLFYKYLVQRLFRILYGSIFISKENNLAFKKKNIVSNFKSFKNKDYHIYSIKNARIFTDNNENVAIIKNNKILPKISFQQVKGRLRNIKFNSVIKQGTTSLSKKIPGTVFNLCQGGSGNNYFHFMFDILPKLYLLKSKIDLKKIDFFYVSSPKKWQIKIFRLIGVKKEKLLSSKKNKHIVCDEILAVDHPWYNRGTIQAQVKNIPRWIVFQNRNVFKKMSEKFICNKKIFLDRSHSSYNHCQIKNPKDLTVLIKKNKFSIYHPEKISFKKQIFLFVNASIIIGAHGAAFTNIIFCKPKTKIIEIMPSNHYNKKCERLCKILKLKYFRIVTKKNDTDRNYPYRITIEKKHLDLIAKIIRFR